MNLTDWLAGGLPSIFKSVLGSILTAFTLYLFNEASRWLRAQPSFQLNFLLRPQEFIRMFRQQDERLDISNEWPLFVKKYRQPPIGRPDFREELGLWFATKVLAFSALFMFVIGGLCLWVWFNLYTDPKAGIFLIFFAACTFQASALSYSYFSVITERGTQVELELKTTKDNIVKVCLKLFAERGIELPELETRESLTTIEGIVGKGFLSLGQKLRVRVWQVDDSTCSMSIDSVALIAELMPEGAKKRRTGNPKIVSSFVREFIALGIQEFPVPRGSMQQMLEEATGFTSNSRNQIVLLERVEIALLAVSESDAQQILWLIRLIQNQPLSQIFARKDIRELKGEERRYLLPTPNHYAILFSVADKSTVTILDIISEKMSYMLAKK
ncbi:hypothetical protein [Gloeobacter violaceus]|uniref:Glr3868 protein n=1 Tax=Gloeobacter violaceus (strain ATCC 29082 / PCC 7421) TaxID=251221 RepID=Q7NEL1_GLOVI|nr:hypothetical protein [Gloeobacter violaceus]BAC91809.1 glr3868 [Gloeobacter violaceus PCC 7421]